MTSGHGDMTVQALVARFVSIALEQQRAELDDDTSRYNKLFREMEIVKNELKMRKQRGALVHLLVHANAQVRLKAAIATLAISPDAAQRCLRRIVDEREYPQAADASGIIRELEQGTLQID